MDTSLFDTLFRDAQGNIVIGQAPNAPILTWAGASILQVFVAEGPLSTTLEAIAFGAILVWSLQELLDGVNYFRRGLGFLVLTAVLISKLQTLLEYV